MDNSHETPEIFKREIIGKDKIKTNIVYETETLYTEDRNIHVSKKDFADEIEKLEGNWNLQKMKLIKKMEKNCMHCTRNSFSPYEHEWTCLSWGYNVIKREKLTLKNPTKKLNFINRLKFSQHNIICICIDVYDVYENVFSKKISKFHQDEKMKK